jgi:hypothetical protein
MYALVGITDGTVAGKKNLFIFTEIVTSTCHSRAVTCTAGRSEGVFLDTADRAGHCLIMLPSNFQLIFH